ncbi:MAG: TetR/AcrR family transcriptional regulator [Bacteroidota bacterium]
MSTTKAKILTAAIDLFNKEGVNVVTLRDIAKTVGISTGNLAYHYKNKDVLIEAAFQQMQKERDDILQGVQQIPSLDRIYKQNKMLIRLGKKYLFLYVDTVQILRNYSKIATLHRAFTDQTIEYVKGTLAYSVGSGNMRPEKVEGEYERLGHALWMVMTFWLNQLEIRGKRCTLEEEQQLEHTIWDMIYPKLTKKGIDNYRQVFAG